MDRNWSSRMTGLILRWGDTMSHTPMLILRVDRGPLPNGRGTDARRVSDQYRARERAAVNPHI